MRYKRTLAVLVIHNREKGFLEAGIKRFHSGAHFVRRRGRNVHLAAMSATPRENVGAQVLFLHSPMDRSRSRTVYRSYEHYRQLDCLPKRVGEVLSSG
jgi:hypothetical protein